MSFAVVCIIVVVNCCTLRTFEWSLESTVQPGKRSYAKISHSTTSTNWRYFRCISFREVRKWAEERSFQWPDQIPSKNLRSPRRCYVKEHLLVVQVKRYRINCGKIGDRGHSVNGWIRSDLKTQTPRVNDLRSYDQCFVFVSDILCYDVHLSPVPFLHAITVLGFVRVSDSAVFLLPKFIRRTDCGSTMSEGNCTTKYLVQPYLSFVY